MLKVLLLIDCDGCRNIFHYSRFASEDNTAWRIHGDNLIKMAESNGWNESSDGNSHFCPSCLQQDEMLNFI